MHLIKNIFTFSLDMKNKKLYVYSRIEYLLCLKNQVLVKKPSDGSNSKKIRVG
ncbi:hypothetical protein BC751_0663 [Cecembia calidifontis]|uniref:Uncharacterized protein n=1 Tax=Cecembia calidifontis TaxID=1187080 RepID=A0A4Q7P5W9_9BACT|nr:hypothetical protein BC751_0663 [Cecembia calidifontis]